MGAPGFHASGRMELRPVLEWIFSQTATASGAEMDDPLKQVRMERERWRLERDKGMYYLAADARDAVVRLASEYQSENRRRMLAVVPGEGAHKSQRELRAIIEAHLTEFAKFAQAKAQKLRKEIGT